MSEIEDFYFFLYYNPYVNAYKKNREKKDDEDMIRAYNNNIEWREKIFNDMVVNAIKQQKTLAEKIQWSECEVKERTGLDAWM